MKIVHLVDRFPDSARYQDYYLAKYHALLGHEVTVVSSDVNLFGLANEKLFPGEQVVDGFRLIRLPAVFTLGQGPIILKGVTDILEAIKPDVIIAHDFVYKIMAYQGALHASKHNCHFIIDNHATYINSNPKSNMLKTIYQKVHSRYIVNRLIRQAKAIVAISENSRNFLIAEYGIDANSIKIIPLGVDCETFRPDEKLKDKARADLGVGTEDILLISTGKFDESKQIHILLQALYEVLKKNCKVKLLLIGKSQQEFYYQKLQSIIADLGLINNVIFRDFASTDRLAEYFRAADIAVYPGAPSISIQEAMGTGLPLILIEDTPYWKEYLENQNGLTFKMGDVKDLSKKIETMLDATVRENMGKLSRILAEKKYNWKSVAQQFIDLVI